MEKILINSQAWKNLRENLANIQSRRCAICQVNLDISSRGPQLDHDHTTGVIRGALCFSCNHHLGWFENKKQVIDHYLKTVAATHMVETKAERAARKLETDRQELLDRFAREERELVALRATRRRK